MEQAFRRINRNREKLLVCFAKRKNLFHNPQMAAIQILKHCRLFSPTPKLLSLSYSSTSSSMFDQPTESLNQLISSVVSILTEQCSKSRWGYLRTLYPSGFTPHQFSQIALGIKNNPHLVLHFFRWTQNPNNSFCCHDLRSSSTVIHILARHRLKSQAFSLIAATIRSSSSSPLELFDSLAKTYRQCSSAPFVFDYLIRACLESNNIDPAISIAKKISPSLTTCNALIRAVFQRRGAFAGYEIYKDVFGASSCPNVETYNELMLGFYRDGAVEMVKEVWDQMDCCPDVYSYCILMEAYWEEAEMSKAEEVWEEMRSKNVEPDVVAYNTMIGGFCRVGEIEMAEEFYKQMGLSGIESSGATYDHLVRGYCRIGRIDSAMLVYKDMVRKDFRPEGVTVEELIRGLCDEGRVLDALEVVRVATLDFGFCLSEKAYEFLIRGLCDLGKLDEALKLQAQMVGKGFKPNCEIYSSFIVGYMNEGNSEIAEQLRKEMLGTQLCGNAD